MVTISPLEDAPFIHMRFGWMTVPGEMNGIAVLYDSGGHGRYCIVAIGSNQGGFWVRKEDPFSKRTLHDKRLSEKVFDSLFNTLDERFRQTGMILSDRMTLGGNSYFIKWLVEGEPTQLIIGDECGDKDVLAFIQSLERIYRCY